MSVSASLIIFLTAGPVTVRFDETERTVSEGGGNIFVLVSLQQPVAISVSVDITFFPGTAGTDGEPLSHSPPHFSPSFSDILSLP